jgi:hypothetical protein
MVGRKVTPLSAAGETPAEESRRPLRPARIVADIWNGHRQEFARHQQEEE